MVSTNLICLLSCSFIFLTNAMNECLEANDTFFGAQIFLLYAPHHSENQRSQIVIYYNYAKYQPGDSVILIENNTLTGEFSFSRHIPTSSSGFIYTNMPVLNLKHDTVSKFTTQFKGHCAYWERDDARSKQFCLTSHPQWMYDLKGYIGDRTLQSLFLPGTHQSGSYSQIYPQSLIDKFVVAQDQDVLEQLIFGARYLDLRPSLVRGVYYNSHGFVLMWELQKIINDIKEFMDNTQEIVIVNFKEFCRGFESVHAHIDFANYLNTEFDGYLFPKTNTLWSSTMDEIWNSKKHLIISYNHYINREIKFMWPSIPHKWGDIPPNGEMQEFIVKAENFGPRPKVTIAAYTMRLSTLIINFGKYILGSKSESLHDLAVSIGSNITQWYNELYQHSASVIAVDYIQTTGIVDVAIEWNKRHSSPCLHDYYKQEFPLQNP